MAPLRTRLTENFPKDPSQKLKWALSALVVIDGPLLGFLVELPVCSVFQSSIFFMLLLPKQSYFSEIQLYYSSFSPPK